MELYPQNHRSLVKLIVELIDDNVGWSFSEFFTKILMVILANVHHFRGDTSSIYTVSSRSYM